VEDISCTLSGAMQKVDRRPVEAVKIRVSFHHSLFGLSRAGVIDATATGGDPTHDHGLSEGDS
jgi:hypothetical protein